MSNSGNRANDPTSEKKTILIVDDEPDLREVLRFELEEVGFYVLEADGGDAAFAMVKSNPVDLVLTDLRMTRGSGQDLLLLLRGHERHIPLIIFISGSGDLTIEQAYDLGAEAIFSKPWDSKSLISKIGLILEEPAKRWKRQATRIDVKWPMKMQLMSAGSEIRLDLANFGLGGFFAACAGPVLPVVGDVVSFCIDVPGGGGEVSGEGVVRWVRLQPKGKLPRGVGVEYVSIADESMKRITALVEKMKTGPYIPKN